MAEPQEPARSFEANLEELEAVVKKLEAGDLPLEESLKYFERGIQLSEACRKQLEEAESKVEILLQKNGKTTAEPFPPESD